MREKVFSIIIFISLALLNGCIKSENIESEKGETSEKFSVLEVYLSETEDFNEVMLNMKVRWSGKGKGAPRCDIYFPPQEGMEMAIGIENGPATVEDLSPEESEVKTAILKEYIGRSFYTDHVAPEFGKSYYVEIKFYWPSLNETYEWKGFVGWG